MKHVLIGSLYGVVVGSATSGNATAFLITTSIALATTLLVHTRSA